MAPGVGAFSKTVGELSMAGGEIVLVVDSEAQTQRFLRSVLTKAGLRTVPASSGAEGLRQLRSMHPTVVVLDLELPDMDGKAVIGAIRAVSGLPIVVLSARDTEAERVAALELGADDFIAKPFGTAELVARIRTAMRHTIMAQGGKAIFSAGGLVIDTLAHEVTLDGSVLRLTPREYELLHLLARHAGKVLTHHQLLTSMWGDMHVARLEYLRVFVKRIRSKIEADPARPALLKTLPGVGYRLDAGAWSERSGGSRP